jgi:penicillin-binding protein
MGEVIYEHHSASKTVFTKQTAYLMTDMMKSVVESGTAGDMKKYFQHYNQVPFVGKTGSTQNDADAWFVGYTPDVTLGVWAGYDQSKYKLTTTHCSESAGCGTSRAKKIWSHVMDASIVKQQNLFPTKEFIMPEDIVTKTVSRYSGKLPTDEIQARGDVVTDLFNLKYIPSETDDAAGMAKYVAFDGKNYIANPATPADMVGEKFMVRREKGLKLVPEEQRKPISHYYPIDAALDGPVERDPRLDDGNPPSSPKGLSLMRTNGNMNIAFQVNNEPDVVGYRLYGSNDGNSFSLIQGKPVSSQGEAQFTVTGPQKDYYMYVLTAVDVAGNESDKSEIKFNDQKSIENWFSQFFNKRGR